MPSRHTVTEQSDRPATHSPAPPNLTQSPHAHATRLPPAPQHAQEHSARHTPAHTTAGHGTPQAMHDARAPSARRRLAAALLCPPARRRQPCALREGSHVTRLPDTARRGTRLQVFAPAAAGAQPAGATLTRTASPNPTRGHGPARPWPGRDRSLRRCPLTALLTLLC